MSTKMASDGTLSLSQIPIVTAITDEIVRQAKEQGVSNLGVRPDQLNAVIAAADGVVDAFRVVTRTASPNGGVDLWLKSHDTGASSLAMCRHLTGKGYARNPKAHPLDPDDFGRCFRFLRAVPDAAGKLPTMADVSPTWSLLVAAWPELERLYEAELPTGAAPKLYARMQEIQKAGGGE